MKHSIHRIIATAFFGTFFTAAAGTLSAADYGAGHWYLGGHVGQSEIDESGLDDSDTGWRFLGGYQINDNVAVEGSWTDLGEFEDTVLGVPAKVEVDGFTLDLLLRGPVAQNAYVFGRVGAFFWDADASAGGISGSDDGTDFVFGLGGEINLTDAVSLRLQWDRHDVDGDDVDLWSVGALVRY